MFPPTGCDTPSSQVRILLPTQCDRPTNRIRCCFHPGSITAPAAFGDLFPTGCDDFGRKPKLDSPPVDKTGDVRHKTSNLVGRIAYKPSPKPLIRPVFPTKCDVLFRKCTENPVGLTGNLPTGCDTLFQPGASPGSFS